uniref:Uncharacterized protein n=1 Tax=Chrysotila carterae TaxID=13221 RepID=A0A7S4BVQ7_CHRCT|mmetsp:Transcript_4177/g.9050  ORF Transcript_4177/g.9050 Transcript_4177/m.9050 type:complete len:286 (-) Transcript_4177:261-1118(-)
MSATVDAVALILVAFVHSGNSFRIPASGLHAEGPVFLQQESARAETATIKFQHTAAILTYSRRPLASIIVFKGRSCQTRGGEVTLCHSEPLWRLPQLSPARSRDLAAELQVASALEHVGHGRHPNDVGPAAAERPLRQLRQELSSLDDVAAGQHKVLVLELISDIKSGRQSGNSWLRPLMLYASSPDATFTAAVQRSPSPDLGSTPSLESSPLRVFSGAAPAILVPTRLLQSVPAADALLVRLVHATHTDDVEVDELPQEFLAVQTFMSTLPNGDPPVDAKESST